MIMAWALFIVLSIPIVYLLMMLTAAVLSSQRDFSGLFELEMWRFYLRMFFKMPFHPQCNVPLYPIFAFGGLIASIVYWLKTPNRWSFTTMAFCAWILCGYPGALFMAYGSLWR